MSSVRVLVGTRKGAFILSVGREAEELESERAIFCGLGDLPPEGLGGGPEPDICVAVERVVRAGDAAIGRWGQDVAAAGPPVGEQTQSWPPKPSNRFQYDAFAETASR